MFSTQIFTPACFYEGTDLFLKGAVVLVQALREQFPRDGRRDLVLRLNAASSVLCMGPFKAIEIAVAVRVGVEGQVQSMTVRYVDHGDGSYRFGSNGHQISVQVVFKKIFEPHLEKVPA